MVTVVGMIELSLTNELVLFVIVVVLVLFVVVVVIASLCPRTAMTMTISCLVHPDSLCLCLFLRLLQVQATIQR